MGYRRKLLGNKQTIFLKVLPLEMETYLGKDV